MAARNGGRVPEWMKGITMNARKDERQTQRNRVWRNIMKREGNSKYKKDKGVKGWKRI
jgi:hypothetical protein